MLAFDAICYAAAKVSSSSSVLAKRSKDYDVWHGKVLCVFKTGQQGVKNDQEMRCVIFGWLQSEFIFYPLPDSMLAH